MCAHIYSVFFMLCFDNLFEIYIQANSEVLGQIQHDWHHLAYIRIPIQTHTRTYVRKKWALTNLLTIFLLVQANHVFIYLEELCCFP